MTQDLKRSCMACKGSTSNWMASILTGKQVEMATSAKRLPINWTAIFTERIREKNEHFNERRARQNSQKNHEFRQRHNYQQKGCSRRPRHHRRAGGEAKQLMGASRKRPSRPRRDKG